LEIVVSKEGKTFRNISISTEISIHLTHQSMDPLQKKFLGLLPGLHYHFSDFIGLKYDAFLKGPNKRKSNLTGPG
jgi:hypothetical protein